MKTLFLTTAAFAALVMIAPVGKAHAANEQNRCVAEFDATEALFPDQPSHHAQNVAQCHAIWGPDSDFASPVAPAPMVASERPPVITYGASAAPSTQTLVAITGEGMGGLQSVNVTTGSTTTSMFVDSGCATMSITTALADKLIANGEAVEAGSAEFTMADGRKSTAREITIHRLVLGGRMLTEVRADVGGGVQLLGIGVLRRFGRFTIDLNARQLILG